MMNSALCAMNTLAADVATLNVQDIMTTSVNNAQTEMMGILGIAVPVVAGIAVAVVAVKFGLKWIKSIGKG